MTTVEVNVWICSDHILMCRVDKVLLLLECVVAMLKCLDFCKFHKDVPY
jgi:hypothetical protein